MLQARVSRGFRILISQMISTYYFVIDSAIQDQALADLFRTFVLLIEMHCYCSCYYYDPLDRRSCSANCRKKIKNSFCSSSIRDVVYSFPSAVLELTVQIWTVSSSEVHRIELLKSFWPSTMLPLFRWPLPATRVLASIRFSTFSVSDF